MLSTAYIIRFFNLEKIIIDNKRMKEILKYI